MAGVLLEALAGVGDERRHLAECLSRAARYRVAGSRGSVGDELGSRGGEPPLGLVAEHGARSVGRVLSQKKRM